MAARRKKRRRSEASKPPKKTSDPEFGTLRARLADAGRDLVASARESEKARAKAEATREPPPPERRKLTEAELMAEAFDALGDDFAGAEKFLGEGYDASDVDIIREESEPAIAVEEPGGPTPDDMLFFETMAADVKRMDEGRARLRQKEWTGAAWRTEAELASLTDEELRALETTPAQRDLLRRSRKAEVPVLTVRYYRRAEALGEVEAFIVGCAARGTRFARIIHGKGRQSKDTPVLKPAVIQWCEGPGTNWVRAWAPEIDQTGQFGSIVVELVRPNRR